MTFAASGRHVTKYARNTRGHTPTRHSRRQTKGVAKTAVNTRVLRAVTPRTPLKNDVAKTARNTREIRAAVTPLRRSGECREIRAKYARLLHLCAVRILSRASEPAATSPPRTPKHHRRDNRRSDPINSGRPGGIAAQKKRLVPACAPAIRLGGSAHDENCQKRRDRRRQGRRRQNGPGDHSVGVMGRGAQDAHFARRLRCPGVSHTHDGARPRRPSGRSQPHRRRRIRRSAAGRGGPGPPRPRRCRRGPRHEEARAGAGDRPARPRQVRRRVHRHRRALQPDRDRPAPRPAARR